DQEGKIQVAQVVEHRASAGEAAGQAAPLLLQQGGAALQPGVLVAADDHGVLVLPQVEDAAALLHRPQQQLLHRQVAVGVRTPAAAQRQAADHAFRYRSTGFRAARTSSGRPIWALWGALCMNSGSSRARSASLWNTSPAQSRVSLLSVSVGSSIRASWTMRGKYMVGGCMP